ncbi:MAG: hypothetical protein EBR02_03480 [Alphaproteobacteria bacterium]|nr:hypothetical protein [Alphaproteobacteria bacterium]
MQLDVPLVKVSQGSNLCQLAAALMVRAYYGETIDTLEAEKDILNLSPFTQGNNERHSQGTALWLAQKGYRVFFAHHDVAVVDQAVENASLAKLKEIYETLPADENSYRRKKLSLDIQVMESGISLSHTLPTLKMLEHNLAQRVPTICIVKQSGLSGDPSKNFNHAIVITGIDGSDFIYNDNNFDTPQRVNQDKLLQAWYICGAYTITATQQ